MEILGALASSIAVTQVLVAGRHVVDLIRGIPEIQKEYDLLKKEIDLIAYFIHESQRFGNTENVNSGSRRLLQITAQQLKNIEDELKDTVAQCAQVSSDSTSKRKWLLRERRIEKLRDKARNAKSDLQNATFFHHQDLVASRLQKQNEFETQMLSQIQTISTLLLSIQHPSTGPGTEPLLLENPESSIAIQDMQSHHVDHHGWMHQANSPNTETWIGTDGIVPMGEWACSKACRCRCHFERRLSRNFNWQQCFLGFWFSGLDDKKLPRCTDVVCKPPIWVQPEHNRSEWVCAVIRAFSAQYDKWIGLRCALRPTKAFFQVNSVFVVANYSPARLQQELCANGSIYHPYDENDFGEGLIEYTIKLGLFESLELLIFFWSSVLRKQGLPRRVLFQANSALTSRMLTDHQSWLLCHVIELADDGDDQKRTRLCDAIVQENSLLKIESILLEEPWALEIHDEAGLTPLCLAASKDRPDVIKLLLVRGVDIDQHCFRGQTALMLAVRENSIRSVRFMLTEKCNIAKTDDLGRTALHHAVMSGSPEVISMLLLAGASAKTRDNQRETILHCFATRATQYSEYFTESPEIEKVWELLLVAGACSGLAIESLNAQGKTALHVAFTLDNLPAIKCLIQGGACVSNTYANSYNMLHFAASCFGLDTIRYFVGLELSGIDTQLNAAISSSPWDVFMWFIAAPEDMFGNTPMRKPTPELQEAFVRLYGGIHDRNIQNEAARLRRALEAASHQDNDVSARLLTSISEEKKEWGYHDIAGWYRGIAKKMQVGDVDSAIRMIEDDISYLQQEMNTSPWDQDSLFGKVDNEKTRIAKNDQHGGQI